MVQHITGERGKPWQAAAANKITRLRLDVAELGVLLLSQLRVAERPTMRPRHTRDVVRRGAGHVGAVVHGIDELLHVLEEVRLAGEAVVRMVAAIVVHKRCARATSRRSCRRMQRHAACVCQISSTARAHPLGRYASACTAPQTPCAATPCHASRQSPRTGCAPRNGMQIGLPRRCMLSVEITRANTHHAKPITSPWMLTKCYPRTRMCGPACLMPVL